MFAVLLSDGEVLTAERLAVVLDGQLMEKFSTSWKPQGGDNATLYLEAPPEKLFEAVVKEEGGNFLIAFDDMFPSILSVVGFVLK